MELNERKVKLASSLLYYMLSADPEDHCYGSGEYHWEDHELYSDEYDFPCVVMDNVMYCKDTEKNYPFIIPKLEEKIKKFGIDKDEEIPLIDVLEKFGFFAFYQGLSGTYESHILNSTLNAWRVYIYFIKKAMELCGFDYTSNGKYPKTEKEVEQWIHDFRRHYPHIKSCSPPLVKRMLNLLIPDITNDFAWNLKSVKYVDWLKCIQLLVDAQIIQNHDRPVKTLIGEDLPKEIDKFNYFVMETVFQVLTLYLGDEFPKRFELLSLENIGWEDLIGVMHEQFIKNCKKPRYKKDLKERSEYAYHLEY